MENRSGEHCPAKWSAQASDCESERDALPRYTPALGTDAPRFIPNDDALLMFLIRRVPDESAALRDAQWNSLVHYWSGILVRHFH